MTVPTPVDGGLPKAVPAVDLVPRELAESVEGSALWGQQDEAGSPRCKEHGELGL